jgi:predicted lipoprotein with Yx(FWY)xxD motif
MRKISTPTLIIMLAALFGVAYVSNAFSFGRLDLRQNQETFSANPVNTTPAQVPTGAPSMYLPTGMTDPMVSIPNGAMTAQGNMPATPLPGTNAGYAQPAMPTAPSIPMPSQNPIAPQQVEAGDPFAVYTLAVTNHAQLGDFLMSDTDMTLYFYVKDTSDTSTCFDACATKWPPYIHDGVSPLTRGSKVKGKISTITRPDGRVQITYMGAPLYYYSGDTEPGDVNGDNLTREWFLALSF